MRSVCYFSDVCQLCAIFKCFLLPPPSYPSLPPTHPHTQPSTSAPLHTSASSCFSSHPPSTLHTPPTPQYFRFHHILLAPRRKPGEKFIKCRAICLHRKKAWRHLSPAGCALIGLASRLVGLSFPQLSNADSKMGFTASSVGSLHEDIIHRAIFSFRLISSSD